MLHVASSTGAMITQPSTIWTGHQEHGPPRDTTEPQSCCCGSWRRPIARGGRRWDGLFQQKATGGWRVRGGTAPAQRALSPRMGAVSSGESHSTRVPGHQKPRVQFGVHGSVEGRRPLAWCGTRACAGCAVFSWKVARPDEAWLPHTRDAKWALGLQNEGRNHGLSSCGFADAGSNSSVSSCCAAAQRYVTRLRLCGRPC